MNISKELKVFAKDLTLLVVEDEVALCDELVEIAQLFFKEVLYAYNGKDGLEIYKNKQIDVVMSDITMPLINGVELSRKIKNIDEHAHILILSAHSEVHYLVDLIDIGIRQFVHKPFDDQELLYRLLKISEEIVLSQEVALLDRELDSPQKKEIQESKEVLSHKSVAGKKFINTLAKDEVLWKALTEDINVLLELKDDLEYYIGGMLNNNRINKELLYAIASVLRKMYTVLSQIDAMKTLTMTFFDLATFIETIEFETLSDEQIQKLKMIEFIYDDIARFIDTVFIYQDAIDIHYLEDSLKSSVVQLKNSILGADIDEEELELF